MTFSASLAISSPFHPIPSPPQIISLFLSLLFIICGLPLAFCDFNLVCQIFYGFFLHLTIYYFNLADLHLSINRKILKKDFADLLERSCCRYNSGRHSCEIRSNQSRWWFSVFWLPILSSFLIFAIRQHSLIALASSN